MSKLAWDQVGERRYETGVDQGVLYLPDETGDYADGFAWNGLTSVTESPSGAESNKQYADNQVYLNLVSAEEFGGTIEAFTYPDEFMECDGSASPVPGVTVGQQDRKVFGLSYRTKVGNDLQGQNFGYKIHLVWSALAAPSEKQFSTINDSPEATALSWEFSTTPVAIEGYPNLRSTASFTADSTKVDADALAALEDILYGTSGTDPRLPQPGEVLDIFAAGSTTVATPAQPAYNSTTKTITIPTTTGVDYLVDGEVVPAGALVITEDTIVVARPKAGYVFPDVIDSDWFFDF